MGGNGGQGGESKGMKVRAVEAEESEREGDPCRLKILVWVAGLLPADGGVVCDPVFVRDGRLRSFIVISKSLPFNRAQKHDNPRPASNVHIMASVRCEGGEELQDVIPAVWIRKHIILGKNIPHLAVNNNNSRIVTDQQNHLLTKARRSPVGRGNMNLHAAIGYWQRLQTRYFFLLVFVMYWAFNRGNWSSVAVRTDSPVLGLKRVLPLGKQNHLAPIARLAAHPGRPDSTPHTSNAYITVKFDRHKVLQYQNLMLLLFEAAY
ncbi:hypothetical protein BD779DRAFT_1475360 [Infundibulicybe gibba]|nr:hypothetical protein BD779DRAFT_1475360 [Infundibulicybe gibba]